MPSDERVEQAALVCDAYSRVLARFNTMETVVIDLDSGDRVTVAVEDPEFGYQMLGIVNSLLAVLRPLLGVSNSEDDSQSLAMLDLAQPG